MKKKDNPHLSMTIAERETPLLVLPKENNGEKLNTFAQPPISSNIVKPNVSNTKPQVEIPSSSLSSSYKAFDIPC